MRKREATAGCRGRTGLPLAAPPSERAIQGQTSPNNQTSPNKWPLTAGDRSATAVEPEGRPALAAVAWGVSRADLARQDEDRRTHRGHLTRGSSRAGPGRGQAVDRPASTNASSLPAPSGGGQFFPWGAVRQEEKPPRGLAGDVPWLPGRELGSGQQVARGGPGRGGRAGTTREPGIFPHHTDAECTPLGTAAFREGTDRRGDRP